MAPFLQNITDIMETMLWNNARDIDFLSPWIGMIFQALSAAMSAHQQEITCVNLIAIHKSTAHTTNKYLIQLAKT